MGGGEGSGESGAAIVDTLEETRAALLLLLPRTASVTKAVGEAGAEPVGVPATLLLDPEEAAATATEFLEVAKSRREASHFE